MSPAVHETALDRIAVARPVAPLPAPEQGKALAACMAAKASCAVWRLERNREEWGLSQKGPFLAQAIGNERGSPFPKKKTASLLPP